MQNKVLKRQLKKLQIEKFEDLNPEKFAKLLDVVELTYNDMDSTVYRLEQALYASTKEFLELNENLEQKIAIEIDKNREQNMLLEQQSRLAALGEMLGNIAHQWRQPLSSITTFASGLKLQKDYGLLDDDSIDEMVVNVIKNANYLSKTIDDFRNFMINSNEKSEFYLQDCLNDALGIVGVTLKSNQIDFKINQPENPISYSGIKNELVQVLINIFNNAKDVLVSNNIKNKFIFVELMQLDKKALITIQDNAGGISADIMAKIFDPYFTTKHKSQGTGLGLYMGVKIIQSHFDGDIYVKNEEIIVDNEKYIGAKFFIELGYPS